MSTAPLAVTLDGIVFGLQRYGGISNYWGRLVRHLDAEPGISVHEVLPRELRYQEYDPAWHARASVHTESLRNGVARYLDVGAAGRAPGDVFHTSYYRVPSRKASRYVVTVYDFIYERYVHGPARWVHTWQKLRSIRRADAVLCISGATRDDVLRHAPDVDPAKVHVVYLGVDTQSFHPVAAAGAARDNRVLYVGQRAGYKRFDLAVEAMAQCPDLTLDIVGPPLSAEETARLESRLHGRWHLHGSVPGARLRELYSTAFAFIFPSDYEGFGLPILEAMACGCPVVAAHTASLPEVGGDAAVYAREQRPGAYAEALLALQGSPSARQAAIEAGLRRVQRFSWDRTFDETLAAYRGEPLVDRHA